MYIFYDWTTYQDQWFCRKNLLMFNYKIDTLTDKHKYAFLRLNLLTRFFRTQNHRGS